MMGTRILTFFISLLAWTALASAQVGGKLDSDKPIEISADELEVVQPDQQAIFRGNVVAVQGNVRLKSNVMRVYYLTGEQRSEGMGAISRIEVDSNVQLATPDESAKASRGAYYVDKEQILLIGDVVLTRGKNILKGERLDYNLKTGKSVLSGSVDGTGASGGKPRVKGVFVPNQSQ
jgi:lipopolysaccharide export system protein LptA